jgi:hypothetical protein
MKKTLTLLSLLLAFASIAQVPNYVPTNGLVGYWPFNGNANDESGNGNNGTVNGATLTTDRFGVANKAYEFDNVDDFLCTQQQFNNPQNFSVALWLKSSVNGWIFGFDDGQCTHLFSWDRYLSINTQGNLEFRVYTASNQNVSIVSNSVVNDNVWHHAVFSLVNSTLTLYVDGVLNTTTNAVLASNYNGFWKMGGLGNSAVSMVPSMVGKIDDIALFNRALSFCEIQQLFNASIPSSSQTQTALDSYTWSVNGQTYTQSGTYTQVIPNAAGCDSTITLNLVLDYTGIKELENTVVVAPNPASEQFTITATSPLFDAYILYDPQGRKVLEGALTGTTTILHVATLAKGNYLLKIAGNAAPKQLVIH